VRPAGEGRVGSAGVASLRPPYVAGSSTRVPHPAQEPSNINRHPGAGNGGGRNPLALGRLRFPARRAWKNGKLRLWQSGLPEKMPHPFDAVPGTGDRIESFDVLLDERSRDGIVPPAVAKRATAAETALGTPVVRDCVRSAGRKVTGKSPGAQTGRLAKRFDPTHPSLAAASHAAPRR